MPKQPNDPMNYYDQNPTNSMAFETVEETEVGSDGQTVKVTRRVPERGSGYDILTDDVLASGNLELLTQFRNNNTDALGKAENARAKKYLEERIRVAEKLAALEKQAKENAALGKETPKPVLDEKDGFQGFSNLTYSGPQTSFNGCWSCAYSLLLKSRGVDLTQEEVRAWRPDYPPNTPPEEKANYARLEVMNTDAANAILPNSDLAAQLLPNTAVDQLHINGFNEDLVSNMSFDEQSVFRAAYREQSKKLLQDTITEALTVHRSPVAIVWDGHYVTITGIKPDGTVRLQDSLESHPREAEMTMDQLVDQGMFAHDNHGVYRTQGGGMDLVWLTDLPVPEYGSEQPPVLNNVNEKFAVMDTNGDVRVNVPTAEKWYSAEGSKPQGQVGVTGIVKHLALDQSGLKNKVKSVGPEDNIVLGQRSSYYPKKMTRLGDPELAAARLKGHEQELADLAGWMSVNAGQAGKTPEEQKAFENCEARLKPYREAFQTLRDAFSGDAPEETKKKLPQALKTLKSVGDMLLERQEGSGLSNLALLEKARGKETADKLRQTLKNLNGVLELGFNAAQADKQLEENEQLNEKKEAAAEKEEQLDEIKDPVAEKDGQLDEKKDPGVKEGRRQGEKEPVKVKRYQDTLREIWDKGVENLNLPGPEAERECSMCVARLLAANGLWKELRTKGVESPNPSDEQIDKLASKIAESKSFQRMMKKGRSAELIQKHQYDNGAIDDIEISLVTQERERIAEKEKTARYDIDSSRIARVRQRTNHFFEQLEKTGTGSYTGLGVISRWKNSPEFEAMKKAIKEFSDPKRPAPKAAEVKRAADTVRKYLDGKEKVRARGFGQERWYQGMCFLAEVMPREEFKAYCDHVNSVRGVTPDSDDFVDRENFYGDYADGQIIISDSVKKALQREDNARDLARILATRDICTDDGILLLDETFKEASSRSDLRKETDAVLADPRFNKFLQGTAQKNLRDLLKNNGEGLEKAWEEHKKLHPQEREKTEEQTIQAVTSK